MMSSKINPYGATPEYSKTRAVNLQYWHIEAIELQVYSNTILTPHQRFLKIEAWGQTGPHDGHWKIMAQAVATRLCQS